MKRISIALIAIIAGLIPLVAGHGMVLDPVGRASRWRCSRKAPVNYDDNGLNCGGYSVQWDVNKGKCGLCGDSYSASKPRTNELGGGFGQGEIVRNFTKGAVIPVTVRITANHKGYFLFNLCCLDNKTTESEACFDKYPLNDSDGNRKHYLNSTSSGLYYVKLPLPKNLVSAHCILQWTYVTGNSWGFCGDGTGKLGCGPQENFRSCSDIAIYEPNDVRLTRSYEYCSVAPRTQDLIYDNIPEEENTLDE
ncbi:uncharacterized protein LOC129779062 [Toxorhynchites rutilus septentrionalis]|uniref:uncharacterized protein LOC129779062 n=1 Tax=Toxorhynchites rutilus septentrionalis TaxID=329112 RepID=UPI002479998D|nr:uncharacterized protein LOC129779062 [Toxorhynchites rutilus septentrionalis]